MEKKEWALVALVALASGEIYGLALGLWEPLFRFLYTGPGNINIAYYALSMFVVHLLAALLLTVPVYRISQKNKYVTSIVAIWPFYMAVTGFVVKPLSEIGTKPEIIIQITTLNGLYVPLLILLFSRVIARIFPCGQAASLT